ncbi:MAG: helix-turn-helix domain containing protein [Myxococcales bacterium]|nr:helix-turn-helix domain containing protein [Myxococcales bacterium]MDD9964669.1 helix-turn-helix domain containing protein [Myxococcales bacterium]
MEQIRVSARRRTQQERRTRTRGRLLSATIECLVDLGFRGTTTLEVERRAEVSRGARIHYFQTKQDLLAGAVDSLYHQLSEHYDEALQQLAEQPADVDSVQRALGAIWKIYRRPEYTAVVELSVAARTDVELRARLLDVSRRHRALASETVVRHLPQFPGEVAVSLTETVNAAMLGMLVQRNLDKNFVHEQAVLAHLGDMIVGRLFTANTRATANETAPQARPRAEG